MRNHHLVAGIVTALNVLGKGLFMGMGGLFLMTAPALGDSVLTCESGLADYQVFQRSEDGAAIVKMEGTATQGGTIVATILEGDKPLEGFDKVEVIRSGEGKWRGSLSGVPTGGPYTVRIALQNPAGEKVSELAFSNVLVGDLWLLAGQSNMQGVGDMVDVEAPSDRVNVFRMRREWDNAKEPIHRLYESPDSVHLMGQPQLSKEEADVRAAKEVKGAGLGLPFAKQMVARTGVPLGLVAVAHGGTSMSQWDPNLRDKGEASLYGSLLLSLKAVGGKVAGVLWYQGESDAGDMETANAFPAKFTALIQAIRQDVGNPNLPFYYVQISRFVVDHPAPQAWNAVQEHQRLAEKTIPNTGVVSAIDLALDDLIHIGTPGLKTLGIRLANLAVGQVKRGPRLSRVEKQPAGLRVVYEEVNDRLLPEKRLSGFSIRDASDVNLPLIYKQEVDPARPNTVLLHLSKEAPKGSQLYYGYGTDPFCNLRDSENMAALAFGPAPAPE